MALGARALRHSSRQLLGPCHHLVDGQVLVQFHDDAIGRRGGVDGVWLVLSDLQRTETGCIRETRLCCEGMRIGRWRGQADFQCSMRGGGVDRTLWLDHPPQKLARLTGSPTNPGISVVSMEWAGGAQGGGGGGWQEGGLNEEVGVSKGAMGGGSGGWRGRSHGRRVRVGSNLFLVLTLTQRVRATGVGRLASTYPGKNHTSYHRATCAVHACIAFSANGNKDSCQLIPFARPPFTRFWGLDEPPPPPSRLTVKIRRLRL